MIKQNATIVRLLWRGVLAIGLGLASVFPLSAHAQTLKQGCQTGSVYNEAITGQSPALGELAPLLIQLDKNAVPGSIIFERQLPPVPWVCITSTPNQHPFLSPGGNLQIILKELKRVGLKLTLQIENFPSWTPTSNTTDDRLPMTNVTYAPRSPGDPILTAHGILQGRFQLIVETPPTQPVQAWFPNIPDLFRIHSGYVSSNVVAIGSSNATKINLIPRCIVKILTPGSIDLGKGLLRRKFSSASAEALNPVRRFR